jgi:hypothetical protein
MGNIYENVGKMSVLPLQPIIVFFIPIEILKFIPRSLRFSCAGYNQQSAQKR